jgi:hypothetical protein
MGGTCGTFLEKEKYSREISQRRDHFGDLSI